MVKASTEHRIYFELSHSHETTVLGFGVPQPGGQRQDAKGRAGPAGGPEEEVGRAGVGARGQDCQGRHHQPGAAAQGGPAGRAGG